MGRCASASSPPPSLLSRDAPVGGHRPEMICGVWMSGAPALDPQLGVYGISVAADLVGMGVQNLRLYEARGLLQPARTEGGTRRYSANDLERLRRIGDL